MYDWVLVLPGGRMGVGGVGDWVGDGCLGVGGRLKDTTGKTSEPL